MKEVIKMTTMNINKLTKEEIKAELQRRLDVAIDRMYEDGFELNIDSEDAFEFVELSLRGLKANRGLNSHDTMEEVVVLTADSEATNKMYAEFDTRRKIEYRFDKTTHEGVDTIRDMAYHMGDGTKEYPKDVILKRFYRFGK